MTVADIEFLSSSAGRELLALVAQEDLAESRRLSLVMRLRKRYPAEQVAAALSMADLRMKAAEKFGDAARVMFFTQEALQQASHPLVRSYRACGLAGRDVLDMGCGIGSDSLSFAEAGAQTRGIELDPVRVAIARYNAAQLGLDARFVQGDVREWQPAAQDVIFFDPARRDAKGKRIHDVERYIPPLSLVKRWRAQHIFVKLSPGVDREQLAAYRGGLEFISVAGDLKEALLHLGGDHNGVQATRLHNGTRLHWQRSGALPEVALAAPQGWLCEPDAALIRAGLVRDVAATVQGTMLDEQIAYFCTPTRPDSPWLRAWRILDWMPFHLKTLRQYLKQRGIGRVTVKKRGSPITPEELTRKLKLKGTESCTLVLTRYAGQPVVLVCEDYR